MKHLLDDTRTRPTDTIYNPDENYRIEGAVSRIPRRAVQDWFVSNVDCVHRRGIVLDALLLYIMVMLESTHPLFSMCVL